MTFNDEHARLVNDVLRGAAPQAAYRVGVASAMALGNELEPTRNLLNTCAGAATVEEAVRFCEAWIGHELRKSRKGAT